jgi:PAS domain S-box-containing protein
MRQTNPPAAPLELVTGGPRHRTPLVRVLMVEDSEDDADLILRELRRGGLAVAHERVESADGLRGALARGAWDIVLSDYGMPHFNALEAFALVRAAASDVPFVIVSGTMGEDTAVEAMRVGVHDYIVKGQLARLVPAVRRELDEARWRREQRALEARLQETQRELEQIVASVPDVLWSARIDPGGYAVTFVSPSCKAVLGHDPEALQTRPELWLGLVEPRDRPEVMRVMRAAAEEGRGATSTCRVRVGAEVRWMETIVVPVEGPGGAVAALRGVTRDVTVRRKMEEQLQLADRMVSVGTLAAGVAHEVNNPLAVVIAGLEFADSALDRATDPAVREAREALRDAREGADRVRAIVKDLKLFSSSDGERREAVDIHAVIDSSARMARNEIRHRARLVRAYTDVPRVEANAARLGQVILNLLVNAAQAIDEGRADQNEIRVSTSVDAAGRVVTEIRDTGCGMPPEVIARIFDPFFTTKPVGVGTGLGLSICDRIVRSFGGEIELSSAPGEGTVFRVRLPRAVTRAAAAPPPSTLPAPLHHGRVLVVDDEPAIGIAIRRALRHEYDVRVATGAAEALRWVTAGERFDVVFCDLMMPERTGMDFYEDLREAAPELLERVVFVTGGAFTDRTRAFLDALPNPRLDKPFDVRDLRAAILGRLR